MGLMVCGVFFLAFAASAGMRINAIMAAIIILFIDVWKYIWVQRYKFFTIHYSLFTIFCIFVAKI